MRAAFAGAGIDPRHVVADAALEPAAEVLRRLRAGLLRAPAVAPPAG